MTWTRRKFLGTAGSAAVGCVLPHWWPAPDPLRIATVAADPATDFGRGVLLGVEEGRRLASLLRRPLEYVDVAAGPGSSARLIDRAAGQGCAAIVLALPDDDNDAAERAALAAGIVLLDARAARPDRAARAGVFRTGVPRGAYARAIAAAGGSGATATLWDARLFRYGAEQLNQRYRRRFDRGMTGEAWAAWMATKVATEALVRAGTGGSALVERLGGGRAAFDGHKGRPLAFTAPDGSLAQPLYVIAGDGATKEVAWPEEVGG